MHKGIGVFDDAMLLQVVVREDCCNYWYNICRMIGVAVGNTETGEGAGVRLTTRAREDDDDDEMMSTMTRGEEEWENVHN